MSRFALTGRTALVTGANTGIGQAIAVALAEAGANIVAVGRSAMDETEQLCRPHGTGFLAVKADLATLERRVERLRARRALVAVEVARRDSIEFAGQRPRAIGTGPLFLEVPEWAAPILEPEIDIHAPDKREAEAMLRDALVAGLEKLPKDAVVMLKLTLPEEDDFYRPLVEHPRVLKVVALSGGYSRDAANEKLARNPGVIASFSRALTEDLSVGQSDHQFNETLDEAIGSIYAASVA